MTYVLEPSSVTSSSASVDHDVAWSTPHSPTARSESTSLSLLRMRYASAPTRTPPTMTACKREGEDEASCRRRVEALAHQTQEPRVALHLDLDDVLRRRLRLRRRRLSR